MRTAYSYQRCSNPKQEGGDTKRRQREARLNADMVEYCRRNDLPLDDKHTLSDWGIPALRGENVRRGALGQFLDAIKKGAVHPGDVLIVEAIDRLTRLPIDAANELLAGILRSGVSIVTMQPFLELVPADLNDLGKRMMMLTYCAVAHQSSADKSKWLSSAWQSKRKTAAEKKMTTICPSWLRLSDDRSHFIEISEAVKIVKQIVKMYPDGHGAHQIIIYLNQNGVPPITKTRKRDAIWYESTVQHILDNRALIGEFQPHAGGHRNSKPIGDPIPNYYGKGIISREEFDRIQRRRRRHVAGRPATKFVTLFPRLIHDARDKSVMNVICKGRLKGYGIEYRLVSSLARHGKGVYLSIEYDTVERAFLRWISELTVEDMRPSQPDSSLDAIEAMQLEIDSIDSKIERKRPAECVLWGVVT